MDAPSIVAGRAPASGLPARLALFGDERLARLVGSGSERAFAAIYDRYHQPLYRYCRSIVRDDADAQDALQSTLASAFVALRRGQRDAPLRPWLFRIAHNEAVSLIRRRRSAGELCDAPEQCVGSAAERADQRARLELLVADLHELPDHQRGALVLRELSGLSHAEIAVALNTSVGAAKQAIFDARRTLMEFSLGRSMLCEEVRRTVSDDDRRALRGRRVRAHLRDCAPCAAFAAAIPVRRDDLQALAPVLVPAASAAILARATGAGSAHGAGAAGGAVAAGAAGKTLGATVAAKALLGAALLVTAAASVTGVRTVLMHDHHPTLPATGAQNSKTTTGGVARRAVRPATRVGGAGAGRRGASGTRHRGVRAAGAGPSNLTQWAGHTSTGSRPVHSGDGATGLPSHAQGSPAGSAASGRRSGSNPGVRPHVGGPPSSITAGRHSGAAGATHPSGASGSHPSHLSGSRPSRANGSRPAAAAGSAFAGSVPATRSPAISSPPAPSTAGAPSSPDSHFSPSALPSSTR
jgi:RNA polymerase sigma factor (sigma-70 family)